MKLQTLFSVPAALLLFVGCSNVEQSQGTYGYDLNFLKENKVDVIELTTEGGKSRILLSPQLQGRVLTSSADGLTGHSFGWINHKHIESGLTSNPQFNPNGGEERLWVGPEGGPNSFFFPAGSKDYADWQVPHFLDIIPYDVTSQDKTQVTVSKTGTLINCKGVSFDITLDRTVSIVERTDISAILGIDVSSDIKLVAYQTHNKITNAGNRAWERESGVPCIWLLGCYNPSVTTTVIIPYEKNAEGRIVNSDYLAPLGPDRLKAEDGVVYFRIDGDYRSKIGLSKERAKDVIGSYDVEAKILTITKFVRPDGDCEYVNEVPGPQEDIFNGDVINSYNDGITETGELMGPFFEIETSSPAAFLEPGESLSHSQFTIHMQGPEAELSAIMKKVFGISADKVASAF